MATKDTALGNFISLVFLELIVDKLSHINILPRIPGIDIHPFCHIFQGSIAPLIYILFKYVIPIEEHSE